MNKEENNPKLAERLKHKIFFENADQDFMFQLFLSYHRYGGSAIGELFNVAGRVNPNDPASWKDEFLKEANKIEELAEDCLAKGHRVSASDAFLRAYTYYRSAFCASYPGEKDYENIYHKTTSSYKKALNLKPFPVEWLDIDSIPLLLNANPLSAFRGDAQESAKTIEKLPFFARVTLERVIWSHGFDSLVDWIPMAEKQLVTDPQKITCAFLSMCAESEGVELKRQAQYTYDHVSGTVKDIKRGTVEDGADLHVQVNNLALGQQMMFDWLDEVLDYRG